MKRKVCSKCQQMKLLEDFSPSSTGDGYRSYCKACACAITKLRYERRKANGECTLCGGEPDTGTLLCQQCRSKHNSRAQVGRKERSSRYSQLSLCPTCGGPNRSDKYRCSACREKRRDRRLQLRESGICTQCGKHPPKEDRLLCVQCLSSQQQWHKDNEGKKKSYYSSYFRRNRGSILRKSRLLKRDIRKSRKDSRECVECGVLLSSGHVHIRCDRCLFRVRRYMRVRIRTLRESYVRRLLKGVTSLSASDIPDDLVAAKRAELRLKRLIAVKSE